MFKRKMIRSTAVLCATVSAHHASAIDFFLTDDFSVDPTIVQSNDRIFIQGEDTLTVDYEEFAPPSQFRIFRAVGDAEISFFNGTFDLPNTNIVAIGNSSIRIFGGDFSPNTALRIRELNPDPADEEGGRIQLFVNQIYDIRDEGGADLGEYFPGFDENFTITLPEGIGPSGEIFLSGEWSNGQSFTDLRIVPLGGSGASINIWQTVFAPEFEDSFIDTSQVGDVQVDLLNAGEEGGVSAVFDPLDTAGATFTAEYATGHATQLEGILNDRGIPTILPELANNEGFDIWFLDYDGQLESGDITLELSFDPEAYSDPSSLVVYHFDEVLGEWEELSGTIDEVNGTITIVTDNLSPFLLGEAGAVPEPSSMVLLGLGLLGLTTRRRR